MENNKILIYSTPEGNTNVSVTVENDTVWLSQQQMAELFEKDRTVIGRHIRNIYKENELEENSTCAFFAQVQTEGNRTVKRQKPLYNLDMIISVGYRVNSKRGTLDGSKRIADNALVALTLMIAESKTEEKDTMVKVIVNLINKNNR